MANPTDPERPKRAQAIAELDSALNANTSKGISMPKELIADLVDAVIEAALEYFKTKKTEHAQAVSDLLPKSGQDSDR